MSHSSVDPGTDKGTSYDFTRAMGARTLWEHGYTGSGVDVALIDSGVAPVQGLRAPGKIVHGPDFWWESQSREPQVSRHLRAWDAHGRSHRRTARGPQAPPTILNNHNYFGVAPDARLISLKVADAKGLTDVTQVIAAIDWVIAHRNDAGMNIRVLSLSFGTDGTQTYLLDPLSFAVERAWKKGIIVVAAAGNTGFGDLSLNNPAFNPFVIAVGASDTQGTPSVSDDVVPSWSTTGNLLRRPDVVAPGTSIVSYRNRQSYIDQQHPEGRIGDRYFKGSGTSQATALTSGAVALLLDHRPSLKPDQVKKALTKSATRVSGATSNAQGHGLINLPSAMRYSSFFLSGQLHLPGTGLGSLLGARGSHRVLSSGQPLANQTDIFGQPWLASTLTNLGNSLLGVFNGSLLSGTRFITDPVLGLVWTTVGWDRKDWAGSRWTSRFSSTDPRLLIPWWVLAVGFFVAEKNLVHLEFRRHTTHSYSLFEIPLIAGFFFAPPGAIALAQLVNLSVSLFQRREFVKNAFNFANATFSMGVALLVFFSLADTSGPSILRNMVAAFLAALAFSVLEAVMVMAAMFLQPENFPRGACDEALALGFWCR